MTDALDHALADWDPAPVTVVWTMSPEPLEAFADVLDASVAVKEGTPVPPLWHWLEFRHGSPQSALGDDGHPSHGNFLPPFENRRRMMAGGRYRQSAPLVVGSTYSQRSELLDARVKDGRSGRMLFTTIRHTFSDDNQTSVAVEEEDVVYRQQRAGEAQHVPSEHPTGPRWHEEFGADGRISFCTDSRVLFRFSALTYNTHRIHYDHPYTVGVEGHPGLVVHGPLLALQMLELPRRAGLIPNRFGYRLLAPAFSGDPTVATRDGRELRVGATNSSRVSASADFEA